MHRSIQLVLFGTFIIWLFCNSIYNHLQHASWEECWWKSSFSNIGGYFSNIYWNIYYSILILFTCFYENAIFFWAIFKHPISFWTFGSFYLYIFTFRHNYLYNLTNFLNLHIRNIILSNFSHFRSIFILKLHIYSFFMLKMYIQSHALISLLAPISFLLF